MVNDRPGMEELPDTRHIFSRHAQNHVEQFFKTKRLPHHRPHGHIAGFFVGISNRNCFRQRHQGRIRGEGLESRYQTEGWPKSFGATAVQEFTLDSELLTLNS